jgi:uncharacterized protein
MILKSINRIRKEINHDTIEINIKDIIFENDELWIIGEDRVDKSAIIGKGGWVVGKLKEELNLKQIHVESYGDFLLKKYRLDLSLKYLNKYIKTTSLNKEPFNNLKSILENKISNIYNFNIEDYMKNHPKFKESNEKNTLVALSGGVDSSFSLIIAKYLGFNPIAITIDPGTIVLPNQFKRNINNLVENLNIEHHYISIDYKDIINKSLEGAIHPCGQCSKKIEETINNYAKENNINIVIYGDMISTGSQSIKTEDDITRINLPAIFLSQKQEIKTLIKEYGINEIDGFGCPLLYEVHKKHPHMKKFSIQRILRETRASALESGEALNLIWSFYK